MMTTRSSRRLYLLFIVLFYSVLQSNGASFGHVLQVILYKLKEDLPQCSQSSIDTLADSVREFLQSKVTEVVHDDDFVIGNVQSARNMDAGKGDGPTVNLNFKLKCTFCKSHADDGRSLRSDDPRSNYNVAYMLRWALQYYLEENFKKSADSSIKQCLSDDIRILVKIDLLKA